MSGLLIKNTMLYDSSEKTFKHCDILISGNTIEKIGNRLTCPPSFEVFDACNAFTSPGFVDLHSHLRDPGYEYKEDIVSGTAAAAAGGFTTVFCMPNTKPAVDNAETLKYIIDKAKIKGFCEVLPIAAITAGLGGENLTDMALLKRAGAAAFSDDGKPVGSAAMMRSALLTAKDADSFIVSHCEDLSLAQGGAMHDGDALKLYNSTHEPQLKGIPGSAEDVGTARDILLAGEVDAKLHICHVSTANSVELVAFAKLNEYKVTAETCPHYFTLTDEDAIKIGVNAKMNPPLRSGEDRFTIIEALRNGTIDCIATDHAPHSTEEKCEAENDLSKAMNGITGFETAFPLGVTYLVKTGVIKLGRLIELMSTAPSDIAGIKRGRVEVGAEANIVIFNTDEEFIYDREKSLSKSRNTPFHGHKLYGKIIRTVCGGKTVYNRTK